MLKWGTLFTLFIFCLGFLMVVFQQSRRSFSFIIAPMLLLVGSFGIYSYMLCFEVDVEAFEQNPDERLEYFVTFLTVLQL